MASAVRFRGVVERADFGLRQHVVFLPVELAARFADRKRLRVTGTVAGVSFRLALLSRRDGARYLSMGANLRRDAKLRAGHLVEIEFREDPKPEHVDVPVEMRIALQQDSEVRKKFNALTPGVQRSILHYVVSARTEETRIRRTHYLLRKLDSGLLHIQLKKK